MDGPITPGKWILPTTAPMTIIPPPAPATGFRSSELAGLVAAAAAIGSGQIPPNLAPYVATLAGIYAICRTLLKLAHLWGYAKGIPDLPEEKP